MTRLRFTRRHVLAGAGAVMAAPLMVGGAPDPGPTPPPSSTTLPPLGGTAEAEAPAPSSGGCATTPKGAEAKPLVHPLSGLVDFAGQPIASTPRILGASATIVDFWASWCGPCRQAFRYMDQLYRTYQGDGLEMIAVSVDEDAVAARRFWAMSKPRFPVAWDGGGEVRERFHVGSLPTTVLFDGDGFLVQRNEGFDPADHRVLEEHVHRLLRG